MVLLKFNRKPFEYEQVNDVESCDDVQPRARTKRKYCSLFIKFIILTLITLICIILISQSYDNNKQLASSPRSILHKYVYKRWISLPLNGKLSNQDIENFKNKIKDNNEIYQKVTSIAKSLVKSGFYSNNNNLEILSNLDNEYFYEFNSNIMNIIDNNFLVHNDINYDGYYGLIQDCIAIQFLDYNIPCLILNLELRHRIYDNTLEMYINNIFNSDPMINIDSSFLSLASNYMLIKSKMKSKVNLYKTFIIENNYFPSNEIINIYRFSQSITQSDGNTYRDYAYSQSPTPNNLIGYNFDGVVFRAPITLPQNNKFLWIPFYEFFDIHHFYTTNYQEGINMTGGNILCYLAQSYSNINITIANTNTNNLIPLWASYDYKYKITLYSQFVIHGEHWINQHIEGYVYEP